MCTEPFEPLEPLGSEHLFKVSSSECGFTLHPLKFDFEVVDALADVVCLFDLGAGTADVG
jgi:hypothetical protein